MKGYPGMSKLGRKPNVEPKTAYEVRRYITLVNVLATGLNDDGIKELCSAWGVEPVLDKSIPPYRGQYYLNVWATIKALSQHVIEYHRNENGG